MRQINKWHELQLIYMPGAVLPQLHTSGGDAEDGDVEMAENVSLLLPSSLDPERRKRVCLPEVTENELLFRMAQLQDSLAELQHTRKIRRKLLINHYTQVAGQGQRANTRSRTVLNSVESRIMLGSNDPNTIPDPTRIRCSCSRIVFYVSARTPLCLDLATIYVSSDSVTFRLRSLVTS